MAILAKEFGWSADYILWDLPLVQAYAYMHACLRLNKVPTRLLDDGDADSLGSKFDHVFPRRED